MKNKLEFFFWYIIQFFGLIFYPKYSGITIIYSDKKQDKIGINTTNVENVKNTSYDLIINLTETGLPEPTLKTSPKALFLTSDNIIAFITIKKLENYG